MLFRRLLQTRRNHGTLLTVTKELKDNFKRYVLGFCKIYFNWREHDCVRTTSKGMELYVHPDCVRTTSKGMELYVHPKLVIKVILDCVCYVLRKIQRHSAAQLMKLFCR